MKTITLFVILSATIGSLFGNDTPATPAAQDYDKTMYEWTKPLTETFYLVNKKYYQAVDPQKSLIEATRTFVKQLDPHSDFMDPVTYKEILKTTQGEFDGIGVIIDNTKQPDDESLRIIDTIPAKGADLAGLRADDRIVQINDEIVKGMSIDEASSKLKGKRGTTVTVKVIRNGFKELLTYTITRMPIQEQHALCYYFNQHNIYYLSLTMFTENSVNQLQQLLQKSQELHSKGIILDLRNNTGGLLNAVLDIAGLFLPTNSLIVMTKNKNNHIIDKHSTKRRPLTLQPVPIFILINNFTASAAEILAGVLRYYSQTSENLLVFIVGTQSFGKGSVQEVIPISNDCALKLTTALYYFPDDTTIQGIGVKPDFDIEMRICPTPDMQWFTSSFGHENSLRNTIKTDQNKQAKKAEPIKEKTWQEKKQDALASDYTILSAVRLIQMLDLGKKAYPEEFSTRAAALEFLQKHYGKSDSLTMQEVKV